MISITEQTALELNCKPFEDVWGGKYAIVGGVVFQVLESKEKAIVSDAISD